MLYLVTFRSPARNLKNAADLPSIIIEEEGFCFVNNVRIGPLS